MMKYSAFISASVIALGPAFAASALAGGALPTYTATYQVLHNGREVGAAVFAVSYDEERGVYTFRSHTTAKGMLRLVTPRPVVERSDFTVRDGRIQPLEFAYEDGSRKGEDNLHVVFDWDARVASIRGERNVDIELTPGVLDRGSMQVALMRDMAAGAVPGPYLLADEDSLKTYEYALQGRETTATPLGELETVRYLQQRQGSSRSMSILAAPTLHYLPVRFEQHRDGETNTVIVLQSVDALDPPPAL
jgi:hypothetical protein